MKPEQWKQIKQVFEVVFELDPEQRAIYLDSFSPTEPELRREVESLLRHHHEAGTMMDWRDCTLHQDSSAGRN